MQDAKRAIPFFRLDRWIAGVAAVLVFLACFASAQDLRQRQQECERIFSTAVAAERRNDPIEAELRYEECRELAQKYRLPQMEAATLHRLAVIRAKNNKFSDSANLFRRAIELDPRNALVLCDFAQLYAERKDFGEAETILKNALNMDPNNPKVLYNLGFVIASQRGERQTEGLRYLKLAIGEADAYRVIAQIYRSKGEISRAEFAEQKAQLADSQQSGEQETAARAAVIASSDRNDIPVRPSPSATHQPQTPPEIVNRVWEELVELERREIAEAQRNATVPPAAHMPLVSTSVSPITPERASVPPETIATSLKEPFPVISHGSPIQVVTAQTAITTPQVQSPASPPVDPFVAVVRQQEPPPSAVRRLTPPPADVVLAQSTVRTLPKHFEPLPIVQSSDQSTPASPSLDIATADKVPTNVATSAPQEMPAPQLVRISPTVPVRTETKLPQRTLASTDSTRQISLPPIRTLPGNDGRAERAETVNPLRQIPAERAGLIDPGAETSLIAALPSYSAVGVRKIPRTDQSNVTEPSGDTPNALRPQPGRIVALNTAEPTTETDALRPMRSLPVRDIDVLQSPSAVLARHETPVAEENTFIAANMRPGQPEPETSEPDLTRITQSNSRFSPVSAPEVISFVPINKIPPPAVPVVEEPIEVAVRPLESGSSPSSVVPLPIRLPQRTSGDSDAPAIAAINVTPAAPPVPTVAPTDPFPVRDEPQTIASVGRIDSPQTLPVPVLSVLPAFEPAEPLPVASNLSRSVEERTLPTLVTTPATRPLPVQEEPFLAAGNLPRLAGIQTVPAPVPTTRPFPVQDEPLLAAGNLPHLTGTQTVPTPTTGNLVTGPVPKQEEPAGFASSRRAGQEVRVSGNNEAAGFARSRR